MRIEYATSAYDVCKRKIMERFWRGSSWGPEMAEAPGLVRDRGLLGCPKGSQRASKGQAWHLPPKTARSSQQGQSEAESTSCGP